MSVTHNWFGSARAKLAVDQIGGDLVGLGMAPLGPAGGAGQAGAAHQQRDRVVADHDPAAQAQLGMDAPGAVGAARGLVDLDDAGRSARRGGSPAADGGRDRQA